MRHILHFLAAASFVLLFAGCGENGSPTAPPVLQPSPGTNGFVWGHVVDDSGVCLTGAVVEIIDGPTAGRKVVQNEPCDVWSYVAGYQFRDLPPNVPIRLRATKDGYRPEEREVKTFTSGQGIDIVLTKQ